MRERRKLIRSVKAVARPFLPAVARRAWRRWIEWRADRPLRLMRRYGLIAARKDDFYTPLPDVESLARTRARWERPSALVSVKLDAAGMRKFWDGLHRTYAPEYAALPSAATTGLGVGFTRPDARTLYYMLRALRPRRYVEVGSGVSTYYATLARDANRREGLTETEIICVEPYPGPGLAALPGVAIHPVAAQDIPLALFESLRDGDVLFIDSSHSAKIDSDVTFLVLEVLPRLRAGVYVHIHDIPFPYNFPHPADLYIFGRTWPMLWNEPIVVQAFLAFNDAFDVVLSLPYLHHLDPDGIASTIPDRGSETRYDNVIGSLWLRRVR